MKMEDAISTRRNLKTKNDLPILSKIIEKIIFEALHSYFVKNNLLVNCQSGFIKGDTCISQLLSITHTIHKSVFRYQGYIFRHV